MARCIRRDAVKRSYDPSRMAFLAPRCTAMQLLYDPMLISLTKYNKYELKHEILRICYGSIGVGALVRVSEAGVVLPPYGHDEDSRR